MKKPAGQTAIEYLLLFALVSFIVFMAFAKGGFIFQVHDKSKEYFEAISNVIMGDNPKPINGGWCDWTPCSSGGIKQQYRSCECPAPAFGGLACTTDAQGAARACPGQPGGWCLSPCQDSTTHALCAPDNVPAKGKIIPTVCMCPAPFCPDSKTPEDCVLSQCPAKPTEEECNLPPCSSQQSRFKVCTKDEDCKNMDGKPIEKTWSVLPDDMTSCKGSIWNYAGGDKDSHCDVEHGKCVDLEVVSAINLDCARPESGRPGGQKCIVPTSGVDDGLPKCVDMTASECHHPVSGTDKTCCDMCNAFAFPSDCGCPCPNGTSCAEGKTCVMRRCPTACALPDDGSDPNAKLFQFCTKSDCILACP